MAFDVGKMVFGVDAESVVGALAPKPVTCVPGLPDSFCGVVAYKNQLVPLIDFSEVLGVEETQPVRCFLIVSLFSRTVAIQLSGWPSFYRMGDLRRVEDEDFPLSFRRWIEDTLVYKGKKILRLNLETLLLNSHWWRKKESAVRLSA
jgi:chemotaxis signal transduction protein